MNELYTMLTFRFQFLFFLCLAELIFIIHLPRHKHFILRFFASISSISVFFLLCPYIENSLPLSTLFFSMLLFFTSLMIKFCWNIDWLSCLFLALAGYNVQHIGSTVHVLIITVLSNSNVCCSFFNSGKVEINSFQILITFISYLLLYLIFGRKISKTDTLKIQSPMFFFLLLATVFIEILTSDYIRFEDKTSFNLVYSVTSNTINLICSIALLIIQFNLLVQKNLKQELKIVSQMLYKEQQQYKISIETIESINMKCHDMRHQIRTIGQNSSIDPSAIKELEKAINIYDSIIKTGNQPLDIIFAEKSLFCQKNNITINCIADGSSLNFMLTPDVYSLFGNILDNAIASVIKLEDDKRFISLTVKREAQFLSINSHNYYEGIIQMENHLPVSSKTDKLSHGYGVKSMKTIVEKYNGSILFQADDSIFNVNILIPLKVLP